MDTIYIRNPAGAGFRAPIEAIAASAIVGGGTLEPRTGESVAPYGYAVAIGAEFGIVAPTLSEFIRNCEQYVGAFVERNAADLFSGARIGVWHDRESGRVYLDLVAIIMDRDWAVTVGQLQNQISIYDLANGEEIPTGGTGE